MNGLLMDGSPLRVGDKVYCLVYGEGVVTDIADSGRYPVVCKFVIGVKGYCSVSYTADFKPSVNALNRTLYWQKPEIIPPPKPKKMVKVWDWFVEWPNGDANKLMGASEEHARLGTKLTQKIDGTEREVEAGE